MKCPICRGVFNKSEDLFSISDRPRDLIICSVCNRYFNPCLLDEDLWKSMINGMSINIYTRDLCIDFVRIHSSDMTLFDFMTKHHHLKTTYPLLDLKNDPRFRECFFNFFGVHLDSKSSISIVSSIIKRSKKIDILL